MKHYQLCMGTLKCKCLWTGTAVEANFQACHHLLFPNCVPIVSWTLNSQVGNVPLCFIVLQLLSCGNCLFTTVVVSHTFFITYGFVLYLSLVAVYQ